MAALVVFTSIIMKIVVDFFCSVWCECFPSPVGFNLVCALAERFLVDKR